MGRSKNWRGACLTQRSKAAKARAKGQNPRPNLHPREKFQVERLYSRLSPKRVEKETIFGRNSKFEHSLAPNRAPQPSRSDLLALQYEEPLGVRTQVIRVRRSGL